MKQAVLSILRHLLTSLGSCGVAHGYLGSRDAEIAIGAILAGVGAAWGAIDEYVATQKAKTVTPDSGTADRTPTS